MESKRDNVALLGMEVARLFAPTSVDKKKNSLISKEENAEKAAKRKLKKEHRKNRRSNRKK